MTNQEIIVTQAQKPGSEWLVTLTAAQILDMEIIMAQARRDAIEQVSRKVLSNQLAF